MANYFLILPFFLLEAFIGIHGLQTCHQCTDFSSFQMRAYKKSNDFILNPGRGFYEHSEARSSNFSPLTQAQLDGLRNSEKINLLLRMYVLDTFVHTPISNNFLQHIRNDLKIVRAAGWNVILRFSYTTTLTTAAPYGDASKNVIRNHIKQLGPIWLEFQDIISVVQAGFIGTWGEWAYSTYFGDPRQSTGVSSKQWQDRKEILIAMLDAIPTSISVQVRTPQIKQHILGSTPAKSSDIFSATHIGRTGHHNDCFLISETDAGTYIDVIKEKLYLAKDTIRVPVGGETCGRSSRSNCITAVKEMKEFHWSFINNLYHPDVLNDWKAQGCYENIEKHLSYRISLTKGYFPREVKQNDIFCYRLEFKNDGFSAPYKTWQRIFILRSKSTGKLYSAETTDYMATFMFPSDSSVSVTGSIRVPASIPLGDYELYMGYTEKAAENRADYYILFANENVPDAKTGLNNLHSSVQVISSSSQTKSNNCPSFTEWKAPIHSRNSRIINVKSHDSKCKTLAVPNASFEVDENVWQKYMSGFEYSTDAFVGHRSIKITNGGASHHFVFSPPKTNFIFIAHSKYVGNTRPVTPNYSLYCDVEKTDGSFLWGQNKALPTNDSKWHEAVLKVHDSQGIKSATCYLLYRNQDSGLAYFDNIKMYEDPGSTSSISCHF